MAGRIPQAFIDELLNRIDIVDVIDRRVSLRPAGANHIARCPFHEEKTPSFTVSRQKQFYHCFGCGAHGTAISFLMAYENLDFIPAIQELAAIAGMVMPSDTAATTLSQHADLYQVLERATRYFRKQLKEHAGSKSAVAYLKQRGLTGTIAAHFEIGYAPPGWDNLMRDLGQEREQLGALARAGLIIERNGKRYDRFRERVIFPIRDQRGRVVGFGGRTIGNEEPKYLNSPETAVFRKGQEIYGVYQAIRATKKLDRFLVVEGYMDVLALTQFGILNAVATLGTATTSDHLARLFRVAPELVFCFDGDQAGKRAAWRALEVALPLLREGRGARFLFLPQGEDPDSHVRKCGNELFRRVDAAIPLSQFLFTTLTQQIELSSIDGRARFLELARPLISRVPVGSYRDLLIEELGSLSKLSPERVRVTLKPESKLYQPKGTKKGDAPWPSLVRNTLGMLLHEPSLGRTVEQTNQLQGIEIPGIPLLMEALELIQATPDISSGAVVEHFRSYPEGHYVAQLLAQELPVPEKGIKAEFKAAIQKLARRKERDRRQNLVNRPREQLTDAERMELSRLLSFKDRLERRERA
ncbi:MAG: DNA primase [Gammaproteobacteria bacterium]